MKTADGREEKPANSILDIWNVRCGGPSEGRGPAGIGCSDQELRREVQATDTDPKRNTM